MVRKKASHKVKGGLGKSAALRRVPCLGPLNPVVLARMQQKAQLGHHRRGDVLFSEGAVCDEVLVITKGSVKIYRLSDEGKQQTLWILGAGDCFCLAPSFHEARYPGTAQCLTDVRVLTLGRAQCASLLRNTPKLAAGVIRCLCHREAAMAALLETVSARQVQGRLIWVLLDLARRRGASTDQGVLLNAGLSHDELANYVGTAREVISRTLGQLQREGLIRLGRRRILLLNPSRLEEILAAHRKKKWSFGDYSH